MEKVKFNCSQIRAASREQLKGNWTMGVMVTLFFIGMVFVINTLRLPWPFLKQIVASEFGAIELGNDDYRNLLMIQFIKVFGYILILIFSGITMMPLYNFFLSLTNKENPVSYKSFFGEYKNWKKSLGAMFLITVKLFLWELIVIIPFVLLAALFYRKSAEEWAAFMSFIDLPLFVIGTYAILIPKAYSYSQIFFILCDEPQTKVFDALKKSKEITKGNKFELFRLDLSFIGWYLISLLPFITFAIPFKMVSTDVTYILVLNYAIWILCAGFLWVFPYQMTARANAYKILRSGEQKLTVDSSATC